MLTQYDYLFCVFVIACALVIHTIMYNALLN